MIHTTVIDIKAINTKTGEIRGAVGEARSSSDAHSLLFLGNVTNENHYTLLQESIRLAVIDAIEKLRL